MINMGIDQSTGTIAHSDEGSNQGRPGIKPVSIVSCARLVNAGRLFQSFTHQVPQPGDRPAISSCATFEAAGRRRGGLSSPRLGVPAAGPGTSAGAFANARRIRMGRQAGAIIPAAKRRALPRVAW